MHHPEKILNRSDREDKVARLTGSGSSTTRFSHKSFSKFRTNSGTFGSRSHRRIWFDPRHSVRGRLISSPNFNFIVMRGTAPVHVCWIYRFRNAFTEGKLQKH